MMRHLLLFLLLAAPIGANPAVAAGAWPAASAWHLANHPPDLPTHDSHHVGQVPNIVLAPLVKPTGFDARLVRTSFLLTQPADESAINEPCPPDRRTLQSQHVLLRI